MKGTGQRFRTILLFSNSANLAKSAQASTVTTLLASANTTSMTTPPYLCRPSSAICHKQGAPEQSRGGGQQIVFGSLIEAAANIGDTLPLSSTDPLGTVQLPACLVLGGNLPFRPVMEYWEGHSSKACESSWPPNSSWSLVQHQMENTRSLEGVIHGNWMQEVFENLIPNINVKF